MLETSCKAPDGDERVSDHVGNLSGDSAQCLEFFLLYQGLF